MNKQCTIAVEKQYHKNLTPLFKPSISEYSGVLSCSF
jgi:hypothetical protein